MPTASRSVILLCLLAAQPAFAQMDMSAHAMGTEKQVPPAELPAPRKMTGIGNLHMRITATPEAQMWFDQGLNLIHDFWDYESARAFEQSVRVDPHCAICYWGLFQAESFYHGLSQGYAAPALARAVELKGHASKRERMFIEAAATSESEPRTNKSGPPTDTSAEILRKLVKDDPKEIVARLVLSQRVPQKERLEILDGILKQDPQNSAANHYYIHAVEAGPHPEQALHSAEVLASLAPNSGHMVHMPGHIFSRMGNYGRAEQAFAAAIAVDERYMAEQHVSADNNWNYVHNLMYAIENLMEEGKLAKATALSAKLTGARGELESTLYTYSSRDAVSRLDPRLPVALRTADWKRALELVKSKVLPESLPNLQFLARQFETFATGMHALEAGDTIAADTASSKFDAELWRMSQMPAPIQKKAAPVSPPTLQIMPDADLSPLMSMLSIMSMELRASLLAAQGKVTDAHGVFTKAAQAEKALGYREPPTYIRPVGETEGAAMLAANHWDDARAAFEQALAERPRSGFALYGIALSSEKSGHAAEAAKEYTDFLAAWKDADLTLPQIVHARAIALPLR